MYVCAHVSACACSKTCVHTHAYITALMWMPENNLHPLGSGDWPPVVGLAANTPTGWALSLVNSPDTVFSSPCVVWLVFTLDGVEMMGQGSLYKNAEMSSVIFFSSCWPGDLNHCYLQKKRETFILVAFWNVFVKATITTLILKVF